MSLTKYEHLEKVQVQIEDSVVVKPLSGTVWVTNRRSDGKVFLATEAEDNISLIGKVGEQLKRLLSHSNLIRLVDIIYDSKAPRRGNDFLVWERCDTNLGKVLSQVQAHEEGESHSSVVPESLCWHVLSGISQALQYLHIGQKHVYPWGQQMVVDDDWQGLLCVDVSPTTIYFMSPKGKATYGTVKLGCFNDAVVTSGTTRVQYQPLRYDRNYMAPEIRNMTHCWSPAAEVWSLGAVLYYMMVGYPPSERDMSKIIPRDDKCLHYYIDVIPNRYSNELRTLVYDMLHISRRWRPTAQELTTRIGIGVSFWQDKTNEEYIIEEQYL